ncbi:MAG: hypothetical protein KDC98_08665 [Planctomycetes bacterium]|nr:hypothetical protein [Planctomycetota bacterium]
MIEAGSQSLWVSHLPTELGHEVMIVDPRRAKLIAAGDRKTDCRLPTRRHWRAWRSAFLLEEAQSPILATLANLERRIRELDQGTRCWRPAQ